MTEECKNCKGSHPEEEFLYSPILKMDVCIKCFHKVIEEHDKPEFIQDRDPGDETTHLTAKE